MDLQVIGRHALMFDDDAMAAFVNSQEALVEWNSLAIDRYDVRHLLSDLPPRKRSSQPLLNPDASIELELDRERYLDLPLPLPSPPPPPPPSNDEPDNEEDMGNATGFHAVRFSYGDPAKSSEQKDTDADAHFSPPFSVPDSLLQNLPPTEKVHQIIARTAMFVSKHGGQSEIILRVKQGDNPTFGFLMPDHHLHPYFRFLVDHQEVLISKPLEGENKAGALSLLGSVYGEDEDDPTEDAPKLKGHEPEEAVSAPNLEASRSKEQIESSVKLAAKEEVFKHPPPPLKEKPISIRRNGSIVTTKRKDSSLSTASKMQASVSQSSLKVDRPVVEPPSELKRVIEKIVEFIVRNGKQFETVLIEQDSKHGRFPFLLSSNLYHPYYLEVLQTEESELSGKGMISNKHETTRQRVDKKISPIDTEKPYESDRKEKLKMVIGKSKKDGQDPSEPEVGVCMDAAATAQILQAARKGIKYPNLGFLSKTPSNNTSSQCPSSDGRQSSEQNSETESAESSMTKEQKLKAERLKRAKLFTAMLKGGSVPGKSESSCSALVNNIELKSSFPINDVHIETEKSEIKVGDDDNERRSKRSYRSRPKVNEAEEEEENNESEEERSRKRRKPHRLPSHQSKDRHKHSKRHSSRDRGSRHRHNHDSSSEIEEHYHSRHRCDDISNDEHLHSRDRDNSSSDNKHHRNSRHRSRHHDNLSDDNDKRSSKHRKRSESEREKMELEEGEISSKSDQSKASGQKSGASRESSVDISRWHNNGTSPPLSVPGVDATDVSDDLRAKIRAMLMATL